MAKEAFFFKHDYNSRGDGKMVHLMMKHKMEGIGIYWCIVEMLYEEGGHLMLSQCERIAFELRTQCEVVESIISDFDLFEKDDDIFWSNSVLRRMEVRKSKSLSASESARQRWDNADALRTKSKRIAKSDKRGEERRLSNSITESQISAENLKTNPEKHPPVPATPPESGNWETIKVNLGSGIPDKPEVKFFNDNSFDAQQLKIFLELDNSAIAMNNDMHNMSKGKLEYVLNFFCRDVLSRKDRKAAHLLRVSLLSLFQTRSFLWEKEYEKSLRTIEWLNEEIEKNKNGYTDNIIQAFKNWYTQLDAAGVVYYKKLQIFDIRQRLESWKKTDYTKVKKLTGGTFSVPTNNSSIEELEKHYLG